MEGKDRVHPQIEGRTRLAREKQCRLPYETNNPPLRRELNLQGRKRGHVPGIRRQTA